MFITISYEQQTSGPEFIGVKSRWTLVSDWWWIFKNASLIYIIENFIFCEKGDLPKGDVTPVVKQLTLIWINQNLQ